MHVPNPQAYKMYVTKILTRVNTITGVMYADDPIIFSLELANEPHTTDNYEILRGLPPGQIVKDWVYEMSAFVRSLSPNHMVRGWAQLHACRHSVCRKQCLREASCTAQISTGEEGYRIAGTPTAWYNDGLKGIDFDGNTACPNISFATVHLCEWLPLCVAWCGSGRWGGLTDRVPACVQTPAAGAFPPRTLLHLQTSSWPTGLPSRMQSGSPTSWRRPARMCAPEAAAA